MTARPSFLVSLLLVAGVVVSLPTACAPTTTTAKRADQPAAAAVPFSGLWRHPQEPRLLAWVSSPWTFSTTSYAIEGDVGLVLIDTQFLATDADAFVDAVEAATGKRAVLAVVLHANPDKFNGTATLQRRGIRVVTSQAVKDVLPDVHERRVRAFAERYGAAYPRELPQPEVFGTTTTTLTTAGVTLTLSTLGAGCSAAHVVARWDGPAGRHVFAGDLVASGSHSWLEIGATDEWLRRLDEIAADHPLFVHPGRGLSGGADLLVDERAYLQDAIDAVTRARSQVDDDDVIVAAARADLVARHPQLRFPVFLNIGLPAELARQRRADATHPVASPGGG